MRVEHSYIERPILKRPSTEDYSLVLRQCNVKFKEIDNFYLQVREPKGIQGWILHVSVIKSQVVEMLRAVVPFLVREKIPFKVVKDAFSAQLSLNGQLGFSQIGKIISIYSAEEDVVRIAKRLVELTTVFSGPVVSTDAHLGGQVYARYGGFSPIVMRDGLGNVKKFIHDSIGQLREDSHSVPFIIPKEVRWPFDELKPYCVQKIDRFLRDKYLRMVLLKGDAKGNVIKGLRLNGWRIQSCIIKEAKRFMFCDDYGRAIQDRLHWQYTLQSRYSKLNLPKIYDFFEENGNTYIVMEFIHGKPLSLIVEEVCDNCCWATLENSKRLELLGVLLRLIDVIDDLHRTGIVHRDITPPNFMVKKNGDIVMIDLELAFSIHEEYPNPPFNFGTNGFMSQEQLKSEIPTIKEDVYSLGAVMLVFFTNLYPVKFGSATLSRLRTSLKFFIQDDIIIEVILSCFNSDRDRRPALSDLKHFFFEVQRDLLRDNVPRIINLNNCAVDGGTVEKVIDDCVNSICGTTMTDAGGVWFSNPMEGESAILNKQRVRSYYAGLYGISGVLCFLSKAKEVGISISRASSACSLNFKYLKNVFLASYPDVVPGLYSGSSGVAYLIASAIRSGMMAPTSDNKALIKRCLKPLSKELDIASGVAGQGIAILACRAFLSDEEMTDLLKGRVDALLSTQFRDGSWMSARRTKERYTGFSNGIAGILCFLLECYRFLPSESVRKAIMKGLRWLSRKSSMINGQRRWYVSDKERVVVPWLGVGFTGIALCFIRAFDVLGDLKYKVMAEEILDSHPQYLVSRNLSQENGIAGIGEVYLEAYSIFGDTKWLDRCHWIAKTLVETFHVNSDGYYWTVDENRMATADFLSGNAGVLHFLLRYKNVDRIRFPLL